MTQSPRDAWAGVAPSSQPRIVPATNRLSQVRYLYRILAISIDRLPYPRCRRIARLRRLPRRRRVRSKVRIPYPTVPSDCRTPTVTSLAALRNSSDPGNRLFVPQSPAAQTTPKRSASASSPFQAFSGYGRSVERAEGHNHDCRPGTSARESSEGGQQLDRTAHCCWGYGSDSIDVT